MYQVKADLRSRAHVLDSTHFPDRLLADCLKCRILGPVNEATMKASAHRKEQQIEEERRRREEQEQERERQRQEQARLLAEKRQRFKAERARVDSLLQQVRNWKHSQELRDYIEAKREKPPRAQPFS